MLEYRNEYRVERDFGRFKGDRLGIAPMYVKRDDQVKGLTRFLSIAVRLLTLIEFVARRSLKEQERAIAGLYLDSPVKTTMQPTAERLLRAFLHIKLIIISFSRSDCLSGPRVLTRASGDSWLIGFTTRSLYVFSSYGATNSQSACCGLSPE